jgi:hypothetical protein
MFSYATAVRLLARELDGDQDQVAADPVFTGTAGLWHVDRLKLLYDVLTERNEGHGEHTDERKRDGEARGRHGEDTPDDRRRRQ